MFNLKLSETGQGVVEFALILVIVVVLIVFVLWAFGPQMGAIPNSNIINQL